MSRTSSGCAPFRVWFSQPLTALEQHGIRVMARCQRAGTARARLADLASTHTPRTCKRNDPPLADSGSGCATTGGGRTNLPLALPAPPAPSRGRPPCAPAAAAAAVRVPPGAIRAPGPAAAAAAAAASPSPWYVFRRITRPAAAAAGVPAPGFTPFTGLPAAARFGSGGTGPTAPGPRAGLGAGLRGWCGFSGGSFGVVAAAAAAAAARAMGSHLATAALRLARASSARRFSSLK